MFLRLLIDRTAITFAIFHTKQTATVFSKNEITGQFRCSGCALIQVQMEARTFAAHPTKGRLETPHQFSEKY